MSQSKMAVTIIDVATGNLVKAMLHEGLDDVEVIDVEISWGPKRLRAMRDMLKNGVDPADLPQHVHWNWALKTLRNAGMLTFRSFGIKAARRMQGLMLVDLSSKFAQLDPDKGKPLVYVDYVETAPWNAREFTSSPAYKGVGVRLIQAAARCSIGEGFSGRIALHSLPQSRPFYTGACEMTVLGPDANYGNLEYFELPAAKAAALVQK
jgi:hypothetical protein